MDEIAMPRLERLAQVQSNRAFVIEIVGQQFAPYFALRDAALTLGTAGEMIGDLEDGADRDGFIVIAQVGLVDVETDQARSTVGVLQFRSYLPAALAGGHFEKSIALPQGGAAIRYRHALAARRAIGTDAEMRCLLDAIAPGRQRRRADQTDRSFFIDDIAQTMAIVSRQEIPTG